MRVAIALEPAGEGARMRSAAARRRRSRAIDAFTGAGGAPRAHARIEQPQTMRGFEQPNCPCFDRWSQGGGAAVRTTLEEAEMEKMLHLLETFNARGSDGRDYEIRGYEHMVRLDDGAPESRSEERRVGKECRSR